MSDRPNDYGVLLNQDIKLHRQWFKEMTKLLGITCQYYAPLESSKTFDLHGDLLAHYYPPQPVNVLFQEHPDQKTLKKMGWVAELGESSDMIHVQYDLPNLQVGALFGVPSGIDNGEPRLFRVISMQTTMIYPASITCEIAPEYEDTDEMSTLYKFEHSTDNLLVDNEEDD